MSSSASAQRMVHQDFIARVRFSNALPPPPLPPKLLDMPGTGLASGQYTAPGFASRLAREQPLNIEADAELGMPLDLIGLPGVWDGDESAIFPPDVPPQIHPADRALLRPLSTLGRPVVASPSVSFLRRTEYISSLTPTRATGSSPRALINKAARTASQAAAAKRSSAALGLDKDSPAAIRRRIDDGFDATARILADPTRLRHPDPRKRSSSSVRCVEALPLLPDLDAFPDSGAFVVLKFANPPMPGITQYDERMCMSLLRPTQVTAHEEAVFAAACERWDLDPQLQQTTPRPTLPTNYEYFLGDKPKDAINLRAKLNVDNPDRDDEALYTYQPARRADGSGGETYPTDEHPCFRFNRLRMYETSSESETSHQHKWDSEVLIGVGNGGGDKDKAAAYFYPVIQRSLIRSQRTKNIQRGAGLMGEAAEAVRIDALDITVADPDDRLRDTLAFFKENPRSAAIEDDESSAAGSVVGAARDDDEEGDGVRKSRSASRDGSEIRSRRGSVDGSRGGSESPVARRRRDSDEEEEEEVLQTREVDDDELADDDEEDKRARGPRASVRLASVHTSDEEDNE